MKNNVIKSIVFVLIFFVLIELLNVFFMPGTNNFVKAFRMSTYDIASEPDNSVDIINLGDSVVYSSISPMIIWGEHGYTSYDCAQPAQLLSAAYKYLEVAVNNQHPKIVLVEASMLFRNPKNQNWQNTLSAEAKRYLPIMKYHDNWKKYLKSGQKDNWIDVYKGYKYITKVDSVKKDTNYMKETNKEKKIPDVNLEYFEKILKLCNDNGAKVIIMSLPNRHNWNYSSHNSVANIANKYGLDFIDLNLVDLGIDWKKDTKDSGKHLNYLGAKKVSNYLGNYLEQTGLLTDHRNDSKYESWNEAYNTYMKLHSN